MGPFCRWSAFIHGFAEERRRLSAWRAERPWPFGHGEVNGQKQKISAGRRKAFVERNTPRARAGPIVGCPQGAHAAKSSANAPTSGAMPATVSQRPKCSPSPILIIQSLSPPPRWTPAQPRLGGRKTCRDGPLFHWITRFQRQNWPRR